VWHQGRQADEVRGRRHGEAGKTEHGGCGKADGGTGRSHRAVLFRDFRNPPQPRRGQVPPSSYAEDDGKCRPIEVDDRVAASDFMPADATSSAPPVAASAAGANSPPGEDPPAASVAADTTAAATAVADKAATPAAPATERSAGGYNQRGRKSQAAKQLAPSAALNKPLGTARGLEHSSESDTTKTTTTDTG